MLDFGFSEVVVTSLIALVVLGPKKLPTVARQVGSWMGRARAMARQLSDQLDREVNADEILKQQPKKTAAVTPAAYPEPLPPDPVPTVIAPPPASPTTPPPVDPLSAAAMHANDPPPPSIAPGLKPSNE